MKRIITLAMALIIMIVTVSVISFTAAAEDSTLLSSGLSVQHLNVANGTAWKDNAFFTDGNSEGSSYDGNGTWGINFGENTAPQKDGVDNYKNFYLQIDLGKSCVITSANVSFTRWDKAAYFFDVYVTNDAEAYASLEMTGWTKVGTSEVSTVSGQQTVTASEIDANAVGQYVRIHIQKDYKNTNHAEFEVYGYAAVACEHTPVEIPAVAPTCTEKGSTAGSKCSECGKILTAPTEIAATGHTEKTNADGSVTCEVCNEIIKEAPAPETKAIEAIPYGKGWENWSGETQLLVILPIPSYTENKEAIDAYDWTITITGEGGCSTFTMKLSSCHDYGNGSGIYRFQTAAEDKFIPVAGEKYVVSYIEVFAGKNLLYTVTPQSGKVWEAPADLVPVVPEGAQTTPGLGKHTEETVAGKAATCTETGLTEGKKCSECGEIIVAQETIAAKGHTEETVAGKAATCTEAGLTEGKKCSVCGETTVAQETIAATGHTEETVAGKAATCTETGLTEGKKCSVCGETTVAQEEIAAKGHTEKTNEDGSVVCEVCGEALKAPQLGDETVFTIILMTVALLGMAVVFTKKVRI